MGGRGKLLGSGDGSGPAGAVVWVGLADLLACGPSLKLLKLASGPFGHRWGGQDGLGASVGRWQGDAARAWLRLEAYGSGGQVCLEDQDAPGLSREPPGGQAGRRVRV